jgi:hypothetical protein
MSAGQLSFFGGLLSFVLIASPAMDGADAVQIVSHIRREALGSSALATAGYSKRLHILEIEFWNGAIYRYLDVPPSVYRDFVSAESKTHFYDTNIKGNYRSLRLHPARSTRESN